MDQRTGITALIVLVILALIFTFFVMQRNANPAVAPIIVTPTTLPTTVEPTSPPTSTPSASPTSSQTSTSTIQMANLAFNPASLTISAGTTVQWINNDTVAHSVNSTVFSSPTLQPGQTYSYTFAQSGTYNYVCGIHPTMAGKVVVQ